MNLLLYPIKVTINVIQPLNNPLPMSIDID